MKVYAVSDSFAHFEVPIREFISRLRGEVELELISPTKHKDPTYIIRSETERILLLLKKQKLRVIYLDIYAKTISTEDLEVEMNRMKSAGVSIIFLIGWAYGVDYSILEPYILRSVSLSAMTLPHSLALLVLLEQLYRVVSMTRGSKYHHGSHA